MTPVLTLTEFDLLKTLTRRVPMLELSQIASGWWPESRRPQVVRHNLSRLNNARLLEMHIINAHPLFPADAPLVAWQPGSDAPHFESLADTTRKRWSEPAIPIEVCVASHRAANLFASTARKLPPLQNRDHDLRLGAVYLHYRLKHPQLARLWIGEHARPKAGYRIKDPDAFLIDRLGRIIRLVESAGRYSVQQFESFHEHCVEYDLPYELW